MPGLLGAAELASIQNDAAAAACDLPCVVQRKTTTRGPTGEPLGTWATIATTVAGMSQPGGNLLANYAYLIGSLATWHVRLPAGTNVLKQDHLLIGGEVLEVQVLLNPQSYPFLETVLACEIK